MRTIDTGVLAELVRRVTALGGAAAVLAAVRHLEAQSAALSLEARQLRALLQDLPPNLETAPTWRRAMTHALAAFLVRHGADVIAQCSHSYPVDHVDGWPQKES